MEIYSGKGAMIASTELSEEIVLLDQFFEVEGFNLSAYCELEAFSENPVPNLTVKLTSAGIIAFIENSNDILLVETKDPSGDKRIELPSGKVKDSDETIFYTAHREFTEETGLPIDIENLKPVTAVCHQDGKGGLQFLTEIPHLKTLFDYEKTDDHGRHYFFPIEGTDKGRTIRLITEPLEIFSDQDKSLLIYSKNPWAIDEGIRQTIRLIGERRLQNKRNKPLKSLFSKFI